MSVRVIPDDAFEYYVSLGAPRSYSELAKRYGVSKRAIAKRASVENWSERLEKIENEARERSDERLTETLEEMRTRHLRTLRAMHARALTALKQFPLSSGMEAMRAAEMAIKLERLVVGEASERSELSVEDVTRRELHSWLVPTTAGGGHEEDGDR